VSSNWSQVCDDLLQALDRFVGEGGYGLVLATNLFSSLSTLRTSSVRRSGSESAVAQDSTK
jgi:hypothetical protein